MKENNQKEMVRFLGEARENINRLLANLIGITANDACSYDAICHTL